MDDILASIRRILSEEEKAVGGSEDVLDLDDSMLVEPPAPPPASLPAPPVELNVDAHMPEPIAVTTNAPADVPPFIIAPEAEAQATSAMGSLRRTLQAQQSDASQGAESRALVAINRAGGPTLEDIVRDEMRPLLKAWLDTHLPPLVERLVAAEIERLVARSAS